MYFVLTVFFNWYLLFFSKWFLCDACFMYIC